MAENTSQGIQMSLFDYFQDVDSFSIQDANRLVLEHQQRDVNKESIRARIYEGIDKGLFERVGKGLYTVVRRDVQGRENTCLLVNGDGRDLSFLPDNSIDAIITDHPYDLNKSLVGRNRNFAKYELFRYNEQDFREKLRVLKPGCFLVEFLPEENADNYEYLYQVKDLARKAGFEYFARVPWKKKNFVANTGRKSKNTEDVILFSKGRARDLRPDAQKNKAEPGVEHFMSGTAGMLPTVFDVAPVSKGEKVHQAEKPVELLEQILCFVTKEDELVLDQFAGSGALGEAALNTHRNSVLIEKDSETFGRMRARLSALGKAQSHGENGAEALHVAIKAIAAQGAGEGAWAAFVEYQNNSDVPLKKAANWLWELPKEQPDGVSSAVDFARTIMQYEKHPRVLECSSLGDKRFSDQHAIVTIRGVERSIEEWFLGAKRNADGSIAEKGRSFDHIVCPFTCDKLPVKDAADLYRGLWVTYLSTHPELVDFAAQYDEFFDSSYDPDARDKQIKAYDKNPFDKEAEFFYRHSGLLCCADVIGAYVKGDREHYIGILKCSHWYKNMVRHKSSLADKIAEAKQTANGLKQGQDVLSHATKREGDER